MEMGLNEKLRLRSEGKLYDKMYPCLKTIADGVKTGKFKSQLGDHTYAAPPAAKRKLDGETTRQEKSIIGVGEIVTLLSTEGVFTCYNWFSEGSLNFDNTTMHAMYIPSNSPEAAGTRRNRNKVLEDHMAACGSSVVKKAALVFESGGGDEMESRFYLVIVSFPGQGFIMPSSVFEGIRTGLIKASNAVNGAVEGVRCTLYFCSDKVDFNVAQQQQKKKINWRNMPTIDDGTASSVYYHVIGSPNVFWYQRRQVLLTANKYIPPRVPLSEEPLADMVKYLSCDVNPYDATGLIVDEVITSAVNVLFSHLANDVPVEKYDDVMSRRKVVQMMTAL
jgi:hypothetical protein